MHNELNDICRNFKRAIELAPKQDLSVSLRDFPKGACGTASRLLGHWLVENGYAPVSYVCGRKITGDMPETHAWIKYQTLILDITIQQFDPTITGFVFDHDSEFHQMYPIDWEDESGGLAPTDASALSDYQIIKAYL